MILFPIPQIRKQVMHILPLVVQKLTHTQSIYTYDKIIDIIDTHTWHTHEYKQVKVESGEPVV